MRSLDRWCCRWCCSWSVVHAGWCWATWCDWGTRRGSCGRPSCWSTWARQGWSSPTPSTVSPSSAATKPMWRSKKTSCKYDHPAHHVEMLILAVCSFLCGLVKQKKKIEWSRAGSNVYMYKEVLKTSAVAWIRALSHPGVQWFLFVHGWKRSDFTEKKTAEVTVARAKFESAFCLSFLPGMMVSNVKKSADSSYPNNILFWKKTTKNHSWQLKSKTTTECFLKVELPTKYWLLTILVPSPTKTLGPFLAKKNLKESSSQNELKKWCFDEQTWKHFSGRTFEVEKLLCLTFISCTGCYVSQWRPIVLGLVALWSHPRSPELPDSFLACRLVRNHPWPRIFLLRLCFWPFLVWFSCNTKSNEAGSSTTLRPRLE